jgi:hypothetical protein
MNMVEEDKAESDPMLQRDETQKQSGPTLTADWRHCTTSNNEQCEEEEEGESLQTLALRSVPNQHCF